MADTAQRANRELTIHTIGHSTRTMEAFIGMLRGHGVRALADVRRFPRSRRLPHFNDESLAQSLPRIEIEYLPMPALGGRRKANPDSINTGWRHEAFRGYADYMQTAEFLAALDDLVQAAERAPTAMMCAEALPWQCHRSLIADALGIRGWQVRDILSIDRAQPHRLTPFAKVDGLELTYPTPAPELFAPADRPR